MSYMPKPLLIDTHAHINFNAFKDDGDKTIRRALEHDVWMINIGAQYSTSQRAIKYTEKYKEGVYAIVGLHPMHTYQGAKEKEFSGEIIKRDFEEFDEDKYMKLLENPKTVGMGEIGLDYGDDINEKIKEKQKQVFLEQIDLARRIDKPVVLHCRKAYDDLLEILNAFQVGCMGCQLSCPGAGSSQLKGVIHCFMGRWSQAEKFLELGLYIGFTGLITYSRDYDKVIKNMPLDRILLETDAPYLTPEPYRGKRNEPLYVKYVAEKIAEIKNIKFEEVAKQTTKNARKLFGI